LDHLAMELVVNVYHFIPWLKMIIINFLLFFFSFQTL